MGAGQFRGVNTACGQDLLPEQVQSAHDKALADFNRWKAQCLEEIAQSGRRPKETANRLMAQCTDLMNVIEQSANQLIVLQPEFETACQEVERLQTSIQDATENPDYIVKQSEIEKVKNKIAALRQSVLDDVQRVRTELMDLRDELCRKESLLARFDQVHALDGRIDDLKQQERKLATEFERLEEELYLTEESSGLRLHSSKNG